MMRVPTMIAPRGWGALASMRGAWVIVGIFVLLLLVAFVIYSVAVKEWCAQHERGWDGTQQVWGEKDFSDDIGVCIRSKSLFSF